MQMTPGSLMRDLFIRYYLNGNINDFVWILAIDGFDTMTGYDTIEHVIRHCKEGDYDIAASIARANGWME